MNAGAVTVGALRDAARDARGAWGPGTSGLAVVIVAAALVPLVVRDTVTMASFAGWAYLALAAVGLAVTVGLAGMPSLAQGAFLGIGAATAALLRVHESWPPLAAALAGMIVAAAAGALVGAALGRLRPAFIAVGTWIVAWLVALALLEFPDLSGGAEGLVVPRGELGGLDLTATVHWELAVTLLALGALAFGALARGQPGAALAGLRERPAAALALGVPALRLRAAAFATSAAFAGLAGGMSVQLEGISDPVAYTPFLSFTLFVGVLLGGSRTATGAVAGTVAVAVIFWSADRLADAAGVATGRLDALFAGVLLLAVLAVESEGLLPAIRPRRPTPRPRPPAAIAPPEPARLEARGLVKRFDGATAVRDLDLAVEAGTITALVGPNGSGKTTALRLLAGTLPADAGVVLLDGVELPSGNQRTRALRGIVRTLQATAVFPGRSALENVLVGAGLAGRYSGVLRTLAATPKARAEARATRALALAALDRVGLAEAAERPAAELTGSEQRLLMLAAALAARPRVLLVDEPSAGASPEDVDRVAGVLRQLREERLALLVVEHNLRLVRQVAERVVVLDAGRPLASGSPVEVAADPAVRAAYLGRRADITDEKPT
jgi:branched-chain amino acid transport system ATP-binding protein/branched-chain amino acid transport system permease protein